MALELAWTLLVCANLMFVQNPTRFACAAVLGIAMGAAVWAGGSYFASLWNTKYKLKPIHHALCLLAGLAAVVFCMSFAGLTYSRQAVALTVGEWRKELETRGIGEAARLATSLADESNGRARLELALSQAELVFKDFRTKYPLLGTQLSGGAAAVRTVIASDVALWMTDHSSANAYPPQRLITVLTSEISERLAKATEGLLFRLRLATASTFLLVLVGAYATLAFSAYRDIRVRV